MSATYHAPRTKNSNVYEITKGKEEGRWRWDIAIKLKSGEVVRKAGTKKSKVEAIKARDEFFKKFNKDGGKAGKSYTVQSWCEYCLSGGMTNQSKKTQHHYRGWLESRVYPKLGPIKLSELNVTQLQIFYQEVQEKDCAPSAAVRVRTALNACLTVAVQQGHLDRHVGRLAQLKPEPKVIEDDDSETPSKRLLTKDEQVALLETARDTRFYMPCLLGLRFGMRIGECCGLEWANVDLNRMVIKVRKQVQQIIKEGKQFTGLKTKNSKRDLPIPTSLQSFFRERAERAKLAGETLVCPNLVNEKMTPQEVSVPFKKLLIRAGINDKGVVKAKGERIDCTHHDLRSTFLTFMANEANGGKGVRPSTLMRLAGHGKIDVTYRYYIQSSEEDLQEAMEFVV